MKDKLLIVGAGETADLAYKCFRLDTDYEIVGFAVEKEYYSLKVFNGKKIYIIEDIEKHFSPTEIDVFIAISYVNMNMERARLFSLFCKRGFNCISYVSSKSIVSKNAKIGKNVFVFEGVVIQKDVIIGDNTVVWNGVQICHGSVVGNNCWLAPSCTICGFCRIGDNSFLGANSTVIDEKKLPKGSLLAAGAVLCSNYDKNWKTYIGVPAREK